MRPAYNSISLRISLSGRSWANILVIVAWFSAQQYEKEKIAIYQNIWRTKTFGRRKEVRLKMSMMLLHHQWNLLLNVLSKDVTDRWNNHVKAFISFQTYSHGNFINAWVSVFLYFSMFISCQFFCKINYLFRLFWFKNRSVCYALYQTSQHQTWAKGNGGI